LSESDLHTDSTQARPYSKSYKRFLIFRRIMVYLYSPLMVVGALWPCPYKYPWVVPPVAVLVAVLFPILWKKGNDVGASLILVAAVAGLASWTGAHVLQLGIIGGLIVFVCSILPAVIFIRDLVALAGAAEDPRFDNEY
jgi:hypothetical protein